jgi:hypothetical protein
LETWSKRESSFNNKQEVKHNNLGIWVGNRKDT